nr:hypothetical protein [Tanacetum cinerariifolium]
MTYRCRLKSDHVDFLEIDITFVPILHHSEKLESNITRFDHLYVVPTGRVVVPTGRYVVPTSRVVVLTGRVVVPTARYVVLTGRVVVPTGRYVVPTGRVVVPTGRVVVPTGRYVVPTGRVVVPTGRYVLPTGRVVVPTGRVVIPTGRVISPGRIPTVVNRSVPMVSVLLLLFRDEDREEDFQEYILNEKGGPKEDGALCLISLRESLFGRELKLFIYKRKNVVTNSCVTPSWREIVSLTF